MLGRIGQLTRQLREGMRELGLDKEVEAAQAIPDARDRLNYVAETTERAAHRALNAIDVAQPLQEGLQRGQGPEQALGRVVRRPDRARPRARAGDGHARLPAGRAAKAGAINSQLMEILMAQDFQDLTGQVIKKIMDVVYLIEQQLLGVLVENIALERREQFAANAAALAAEVSPTGSPEHLLNGPQINPEGKTDVVQDQSQVDDLLASLGF